MVDTGHATVEAAADNPVIFGVRLGGSRRLQFAALAAGALISSLGFSLLQESVFRVPGFSFGGWMTFWMYGSWVVCGFLEQNWNGGPQRRGSLVGYAVVALTTCGGVYFTNWALNFLNYTTRVVAKSCKVLPVMAFRVLIQRKHHSLWEYLAALVLASGISAFLLGDRQAYPQFNAAGLFLICLGVVCDAVTSNLEERWFFDIRPPCDQAEVVYYLSQFSCGYSLILLVATGEAWPAFEHSVQNMLVVPSILAFSMLGYVSVDCVLLLIKHFGATNTEIVKSLRKVLQVSLSLMVFPKPLNASHGIGYMLVFLSLMWMEKLRRRRSTTSGPQELKAEDKV
ncbi:unnamed protein product [Ostreobium quekettii]|uniref:Uncharacterized protein n=1 Tax=Ostreobium quekettii TaxID=121088 RepID=A0A8S1J935_9CHLO|nr:unnamed protein product [Ostreobium quekettii]|eukprot:evm.model.scf_546EXC.2 EVM.evm.TU.scf_546EXC.2   scf_546EXC:44727-50041(-)